MPQFDRRIPRAEQWLYEQLPFTQRAVRATIYAITEAIGVGTTRYPDLLRGLELVSRAYMRRVIPDPQLRRRLRPSYRLGCKRILFSNDYYPALARPNVDVVTDPIVRVSKSGIVDGSGAEHELDVLVCATGFSIEDVFNRLSVRGRGGANLRDVWASGIEAHRGTTIAGFPNLALLSGPNTGTGSTSQVFMIEAQIRHVLGLLKAMRREQAGSFEPRAQAQAAYNAWLQERMRRTVWLRGGCNSWYLDSEGVNRTLYPASSLTFKRSLRHVDPAEYELEPLGSPATKPPIEVAA
jgi:cation diffusion facilitator CzcD-associated flavoprotein CzcO